MSDLFSTVPAAKNPTNIPELSVSDLSGALKRTLEDAFGRVRVRGELSKVAFPASGHMYSALKDDNAVIDAVCWKSQLGKLKIKPAEGLEVICTGRITTYPARSSYQLVIEQMELAGIGAILKMIEDRRVKLAGEGLFNQDRKKPLPVLPRVIGVITSPTGAVIRDILHRLSDRFPVHVIIWPVTVQGERAADEVTNAIRGLGNIQQGGPIPRPDVIIVARGGGSIEDLMPFNEESVVRAAANCPIPLISAVGHETDTTLIDYAADVRAPTPTAAAEMAVPVRDDLIYTVNTLAARLLQGPARLVREYRARLGALTTALPSADRLLELPRQRLDHLDHRLARAGNTYLGQTKAQVGAMAARLIHPAHLIRTKAELLAVHTAALTRAGKNIPIKPGERLQELTRLLATLSFHQTLARGFAVVRGANGSLITDADSLATGDQVGITFAGDKTRTAHITK